MGNMWLTLICVLAPLAAVGLWHLTRKTFDVLEAYFVRSEARRSQPATNPAQTVSVSPLTPEAKTDSETAALRRERRQKDFSSVVLTAFLLGLAYFLGWSHEPFLMRRNESGLREYLGELVFAIATAAMVSAWFSRMLDLPEVLGKFRKLLGSPEHLAEIESVVKDVITGPTYLKSLSLERIRRLRRDIDEALYGDSLEDKDSLYNFVTGRLNDQYSQSFRRNMTFQLSCRRVEQHLEFEETRSFHFMRNPEDKSPAPEASFRVSDHVDLEWLQLMNAKGNDELMRNTILDLRLVIGCSKFGYLRFKWNPSGAELIYDADGSDSKIEPARASITLKSGLDENLRWNYSFETEFPDELRAEPDVWVETFTRRKKAVKDDLFYLNLLRPTRNITWICDFPDDIRLELVKFQFANEEAEPIQANRLIYGHGFSRIDDWALPGHGICLAWYGFDRVSGSSTNLASDHLVSEHDEPALSVSAT